MNFSLYIARRYLFTRKKRNAINIISFISVLGVAVGVMALVVVLSVFNGFDQVIRSLINSFDPDIKIELKEGKVFLPEDASKSSLLEIDGIEAVAEIFEENALVRYDERQFIATLKGVDENYIKVSGVDTMIREGEFILKKGNQAFAVVGQGVAFSLRVGLNFIKPLIFYVPKRTGEINMVNPVNSFNRSVVFPSGIFSIEQEYDSKYVLLPVEIVRDLLDYPDQVTSLEVKIRDGMDKNSIQEKIRNVVGDNFTVLNRYEQNEVFYRIMRTEKWATFLILTLILIIASFNIVGSLTMLIIDKQDDIITLRNLGANNSLIRKIFLTEGWLISITGSLAGIILGTLISLLQEHLGVIKIGGSGTMIIDAYPVHYQFPDILLVWITVLLIGYFAAYIPVRKISLNRYTGIQNS